MEAWGRSPDNPVHGWYGLKNGYRGRFGVYIPPLMEELGLVDWNTTRKITGCVPSNGPPTGGCFAPRGRMMAIEG